MIINGLILAAGASERLGQAKQLVTHKGISLLSLTEQKILPAVAHLFVVLGYQHNQFKSAVHAAEIVINPNWEQGQGHSLFLGMQQASKSADAVLVGVCDQAKIPPEHYRQLTATAALNPGKIIATAYAGTAGVPVVLPATFCLMLQGGPKHKGAQYLLQQHPEAVISLACEAAAFDVDHPEDLAQL